MPFKVLIEDADGIVHIIIYGAATNEEHLEARKKATQIAQAKGLRKFLIDLSDLQTERGISTMSCFEFGSTYQKEGMPTGSRLAHVLPRDEKARRDVQFTSTVGINRGVVIAEFDTEAEARNWLAS